MKHPYNISIDFHDVGASLQVGCKRLAYTDLQQMLIDLSAYVNNPEATIEVMQEQYPSLKEQRGIEWPQKPSGVAFDPENYGADALSRAASRWNSK